MKSLITKILAVIALISSLAGCDQGRDASGDIVCDPSRQTFLECKESLRNGEVPKNQ